MERTTAGANGALSRSPRSIQKLISGGQTGADRAALDWAIRNSVPHGGFCPKGRRSLDGVIPEIYKLKELFSTSYLLRTEANVLAADGTLLITLSHSISGGTSRTARFCAKHGKPVFHVWAGLEDAGKWVRAFVEEHKIHILNVAGPRASSAPTIEILVGRVLDEAFGGVPPRSDRQGDQPVNSAPLRVGETEQTNPLTSLFFLTAELEVLSQRLQSQADQLSLGQGMGGVSARRCGNLLRQVRKSKDSMVSAMSMLMGEYCRE